MPTLTARRYVPLQLPAAFRIGPCSCGTYALHWSDLDGHVWCGDCQKDFVPTDMGLLTEPIDHKRLAAANLTLDREDIETKQIEIFNGSGYNAGISLEEFSKIPLSENTAALLEIFGYPHPKKYDERFFTFIAYPYGGDEWTGTLMCKNSTQPPLGHAIKMALEIPTFKKVAIHVIADMIYENAEKIGKKIPAGTTLGIFLTPDEIVFATCLCTGWSVTTNINEANALRSQIIDATSEADYLKAIKETPDFDHLSAMTTFFEGDAAKAKDTILVLQEAFRGPIA